MWLRDFFYRMQLITEEAYLPEVVNSTFDPVRVLVVLFGAILLLGCWGSYVVFSGSNPLVKFPSDTQPEYCPAGTGWHGRSFDDPCIQSLLRQCQANNGIAVIGEDGSVCIKSNPKSAERILIREQQTSEL